MSTATESTPKPVTVNCPACQAVNPGADVNSACSECGELLGPAVIQHTLDELRRLNERMAEVTAPSFYSFNGFGTMLLDYHKRADGAWQATRWVVAAGLPVMPLATYVIRPRRQEFAYHRMTSHVEILGRVPVTPLRVLRVHALVLLGLAPIVLGSLNSGWVNRTLGGPLAALAMLACVAWGAYIIFFRIRNDSKAFKAEAA